MFSKESLRQAAAPAAFLLVASVACSLVFGYGMGIIPILIQEIIAYLFGYFLVIRTDRPRYHLWIVYAVFFALLNIGNIAERLGWMG